MDLPEEPTRDGFTDETVKQVKISHKWLLDCVRGGSSIEYNLSPELKHALSVQAMLDRL